MYEGQHCEFDKGKVPECVMECENGGECTLGVKNYVMAVLGYNGFWKNHEKAMYCSCPKGFYGLKCDVPANKCGDFECFNGAQVSSAQWTGIYNNDLLHSQVSRSPVCSSV
jgi:hypothetical protein